MEEDERTKNEYLRAIMDKQRRDIFDPNSWLMPITRFLSQYTLSPKYKKWYLPALAVIAFVVGYFNFDIILYFERLMPDFFFTYSQGLFFFTYSQGLLALAAIGQAVLGATALIFFVISRKYYLPLFIYAGFLVQYIGVIKSTARFPLIPTSFVPILIYAITGIILTIGLKFGKKMGLVLALLINILFLANYNSKLMTGSYLSFRDIFYPAKLEQSLRPIIQAPQEIAKTSSSWCHIYTREQHRSASGSTQNLKEALELAGYKVFLLDEKKNLPVSSPLISIEDFQKAQGLPVTGALNLETSDAIDKLYSCGKASDYGLAFGDVDAPVSFIGSAFDGSLGVAQGNIVEFNNIKPLVTLDFISRNYQGGASNSSEYPSLNYLFATNFSGNKTVLKNAVCDPSVLAGIGILVGRFKLIACKEVDNGYVGYVTYQNAQDSRTIVLHAIAVLRTGSARYPTVYVETGQESEIDSATLNEFYDGVNLTFPDLPLLSPEMYIQKVTQEYNNPNSQITFRAATFETFVKSIRSRP